MVKNSELQIAFLQFYRIPPTPHLEYCNILYYCDFLDLFLL